MWEKMILIFEIKIENENIDLIWMMPFLVFIIWPFQWNETKHYINGHSLPNDLLWIINII
jgi:hypothetical protein